MKVINTLTDALPAGVTEGLWVYNGLDCCVTLEVKQAIEPKLNEITQKVYDFERALQGPILEMTCRGVAVDQEARHEIVKFYTAQLRDLESYFCDLLTEGLGLPEAEVTWTEKKKGVVEQKFLWNSPVRLQKLFYDRMQIKPIKFKGRVSVDAKALEKIKDYYYAEPIVLLILAIRDISKKLGVLRTGIDRDGRIRTSFNIAGTDTGRLASYASSFGTGTNMQNITGELRRVFVADRGYRLAYIDLEQAEARAVGAIIWNLFKDGTYLDFCESGDLHTNVCKMTFDLPWTGDPKKDKDLAKQPFFRHFDYRDASKRLGHASNYFGQPPHVSKQVHIPLDLVQNFQRRYFSSFEGIPNWHQDVRKKLINQGFITTFMGRQRWFFGRRFDLDTLRAAIAFEPQSAIGDYMNQGLLAVWRESITGRLPVQLLLQVHDAIVFQYPEHLENEIIPRVQELCEIEVPLAYGRTLKIPTEAMVGWNWAYTRNSKGEIINADGLEKFTGNDTRTRTPAASLLDRRFS